MLPFFLLPASVFLLPSSMRSATAIHSKSVSTLSSSSSSPSSTQASQFKHAFFVCGAIERPAQRCANLPRGPPSLAARAVPSPSLRVAEGSQSHHWSMVPKAPASRLMSWVCERCVSFAVSTDRNARHGIVAFPSLVQRILGLPTLRTGLRRDEAKMSNTTWSDLDVLQFWPRQLRGPWLHVRSLFIRLSLQLSWNRPRRSSQHWPQDCASPWRQRKTRTSTFTCSSTWSTRNSHCRLCEAECLSSTVARLPLDWNDQVRLRSVR